MITQFDLVNDKIERAMGDQPEMIQLNKDLQEKFSEISKEEQEELNQISEEMKERMPPVFSYLMQQEDQDLYNLQVGFRDEMEGNFILFQAYMKKDKEAIRKEVEGILRKIASNVLDKEHEEDIIYLFSIIVYSMALMRMPYNTLTNLGLIGV